MEVSRDFIESELSFLGLLVMENKLKPQTTGVIKDLQTCNIRTIMATGDNVLTGMSVARQCEILDAKKEVWLGELSTSGGVKGVIWKSTDPKKSAICGKLPWNYTDD